MATLKWTNPLARFVQSFPKGNKMGTALVVTTLLMVTYGTFMVASASEGLAVASGSNFGFMSHDLLFVGLSVVVLVIMARMPITFFVRWGLWIIGIGIVGLAYVMVAGSTSNGGRRWISLFGQQIQPSEVFKMAVVFYVAWVISKFHKELGEWRQLALRMVPVGLGVLLILLEHDIGTATIVGVMAFSMLIIGGASALQMAVASGFAVTAIAIYASANKYARARFSFLHLSTQHGGSNYQLFQSQIALGSGGWRGLGYGNSRMKWGMLPNPHTDFIFSIIGEELGFIGTLAVIGLFMAFLIFATRIIKGCRNDVLRLIAVGLTTWIALEALINIASVIGSWPVTGVPLPFFSYGGTALIMQMAAVGLLYNIAHDTSSSHTSLSRKDVKLPSPVGSSRRSGLSSPGRPPLRPQRP